MTCCATYRMSVLLVQQFQIQKSYISIYCVLQLLNFRHNTVRKTNWNQVGGRKVSDKCEMCTDIDEGSGWDRQPQ
jgi:hypothetical protein